MDKNRTAFEAQREALQDANAHPERRSSHEAPVRIYLTEFRYAQSHPQPTSGADEPAQPVDEPAPLAYPGTA